MIASGPIDLHSHVTPKTLPGNPGSLSPWPSMCCDCNDRATMMVGDKPFRELDARSWDVQRRREDMTRDGIAVQVLSPMPELLSYWQTGGDCEYLADYMNDAIASMVASDPKHFRGLGMIPMQDPSRAVDYLATLKSRFGLTGIQIGSNINGVLPGDAQFEPVLAAAESQDLCVFIHALHPVATKSVMQHSPFFGPMVGFPLDTAMAAASLILEGVLERLPRLRVALSHGGGAMASLLGRLDQGRNMAPALRDKLSIKPSDQVRKLFYDSNVYEPNFLRHLVRDMAPGRICLGTDYPYLIMQDDPLGFVEQAALTEAEVHSVQFGAARAFLGLAGASA